MRVDNNTVATAGFESDNCDRDFEMLIGCGAEAREAPANKPWGVRQVISRAQVL